MRAKNTKSPGIERETMLRVIECMRDGVYVVGQNYDIEYVSPILEREYGDWRGIKCYQYFEVREGVCADCRIEEVFSGETIRYEWYSVKNGKTFEVIDTPLINPDGSRSKLEIFRDITERKQAEKELKRYRDQLEQLVERRTADLQRSNAELRTRERYLTCLSEISHHLLLSNELGAPITEIVRLLGKATQVGRCFLVENDRTADQGPTCKRLYEWTSEDGASSVNDKNEGVSYSDMGLGDWARRFFRGEIVTTGFECAQPDEQSPLERCAPVAVLAVPLIVADEWSGFVAIETRDSQREWGQEMDLLQVAAGEIAVAMKNVELSRRIREHASALEDRVADRTAELFAANRELETFASSVSHDLRAPLHRIMGFADALYEDYGDTLDSDGKLFLERVLDSSQHMGRLIEALLGLSRIAQQEMHRKTVDLSANARRIIEDHQDDDPNRTVEVSIAPGLEARGDANLLRLVLENLLGNAWKFTEKTEEAKIEFAQQSPDEGRAFFVRDNGAGFDMELADRLFQPFRRLHSQADFQGTGVGLATVHRIVTRHGGRVWAEAKPGHGATFFFVLSSAL